MSLSAPVLFIVVTNAVFAGIADGQIQGSYTDGAFTYYITGNLTPPSPTLYIMRQNVNGSFLANQSKQPGLTASILSSFFGWPIPA